MLEIGTQTVAIADLHEWPENPRQIDREAFEHLKHSLGAEPELMQARPLIALPDGTVIAGNMRLRAATELGWIEIPTFVVDADENRAREIALRDNNQFGEWDRKELASMLSELDSDPLLLGFDSPTIDAMMASLEPKPEPSVPKPPAEPITKPGDLIELGEHRLLCGDATDVGDAAIACHDAASCMWTDPPYGVEYVGKTADSLTIDNDRAQGLNALLNDAFSAADQQLADGAAIYVAHAPGALSTIFGNAFAGIGWRWHQTLIWDKQTMVLGHADYHYRHEPIILGYKAGNGRYGRGGEGWYGDNKQTSVFSFPKPSRSANHPTMKPVELIEAMLVNSTRRGEIVLDPFGGSGSTLIACENLDRKCAMIEIDPAYCDVIVTRWEQHTGKKAKRPG